MDFLSNYFQLLFISTLIVFPISLLFYCLLKYKLIKKDDTAREKYLLFTKKLMQFSFVGALLTFFLKDDSEITNRSKYVDSCVSDISSNLTPEQKSLTCQCSHDFLYEKYKDAVYESKTVYKFEDKREMVICFLKAKRPDLSDSIINIVRNKIVNESDISSAVKQVEDL